MWQWYPKIECNYFEHRIGVWKDVIRMIKTPMRHTNKADIPLWSFYVCVDKRDMDYTTEGRPHACGGNMRLLNALQVDYDDGIVRIGQFIDEHEGLEYALYTSPGHKDNHHKFRVIIPLAKPLENVYLTKSAVKTYLLEMFHDCDMTTINSFRKQRMPNLPVGGDAYRCHISEGKRLELDMRKIAELATQHNDSEFSSTVEEMDPYGDFDVLEATPEQLAQWTELHRLMQKYSEDLVVLKDTPRGGGQVHYALMRMAAALRLCGMSDESLVEYFERNSFSGKEILEIIAWTSKLENKS